MTGFPNLPFARGDTDDDASVHPYSLVGPAIPVLRAKASQKIVNILNESHTKEKSQGSPNIRELNESFAEFVRSTTLIPETKNLDDEITNATSEIPFNNKDSESSSKSHMQSTKSLKFWLGGFLVGIAFLIGLHFSSVDQGIKHIPSNSFSINSRLSELEQSLADASDISSECKHQVEVLDSKQSQQGTTLKSEINFLEGKLDALSANLSLEQNQHIALRSDISQLKKMTNGLELLTAAPNDFEERLSRLASKISQLSHASTDLQEVKDNLLQELMQKLPQHLPVFIQNNKIHSIPEFHDYVLSLLQNFDFESLLDWDRFMHSHENELRRFIQAVSDDKKERVLTIYDVEKLLQQKLAETYPIQVTANDSGKEYTSKTQKLSVDESTHAIILDDLLEIIGRGSVKVNYAAFSLGARILGFLTSTGDNSIGQKSLTRKVFLGWYDFFTSNGLQSPQNSKYNANNILFDGGQYWQCESNQCSFGLRLPSSIILTDIIVRNPLTEKPAGLHLPDSISVFIKPKTKSQAAALRDYSQSFGDGSGGNKYLSKYFKVMEFDLDNSMPVQYLQLPLKLVNLKISIRDLFVQIRSRRGNTGLYNIKAYGLTEFAAEKYSHQFDVLLDKLTSNENERSTGSSNHESYVIEDDDYI